MGRGSVQSDLVRVKKVPLLFPTLFSGTGGTGGSQSEASVVSPEAKDSRNRSGLGILQRRVWDTSTTLTPNKHPFYLSTFFHLTFYYPVSSGSYGGLPDSLRPFFSPSS